MADVQAVSRRRDRDPGEVPRAHRARGRGEHECQYCQHFHRGAAQLHGATEEELAEPSFLASYTARYSAMLHAQEYDLETFEEETARIAEHFQAAMAEGDD